MSRILFGTCPLFFQMAQIDFNSVWNIFSNDQFKKTWARLGLVGILRLVWVALINEETARIRKDPKSKFVDGSDIKSKADKEEVPKNVNNDDFGKSDAVEGRNCSLDSIGGTSDESSDSDYSMKKVSK